jgi:RNA polymerase sigma-70 factor (ECF subfamily)
MIAAQVDLSRGSWPMTLTTSVADPDADPDDATSAAPIDPESSMALVLRARGGDRLALEQLFARYSTRLLRWAHGRLPAYARSLGDTHDLVQDTMLKVYLHFDRFQPRHAGAFLAYVRQTLHNSVTDRIRYGARRPTELIDDSFPSDQPSQHDEFVAQELLERYERALARLRPAYREAIVARLELGLPWLEVMDVLGKPSVPAAQITVSRAVMRLADEMATESTR